MPVRPRNCGAVEEVVLFRLACFRLLQNPTICSSVYRLFRTQVLPRQGRQWPYFIGELSLGMNEREGGGVSV